MVDWLRKQAGSTCPPSLPTKPACLEQDLCGQHGGEDELVAVKQPPLSVRKHGERAGVKQGCQPGGQLFRRQLSRRLLLGQVPQVAEPIAVPAAVPAGLHAHAGAAGVRRAAQRGGQRCLADDRLPMASRHAAVAVVAQCRQPPAARVAGAGRAVRGAAAGRLHHVFVPACLLRLPALHQVVQRGAAAGTRCSGRLTAATGRGINAALKHILGV